MGTQDWLFLYAAGVALLLSLGAIILTSSPKTNPPKKLVHGEAMKPELAGQPTGSKPASFPAPWHALNFSPQLLLGTGYTATRTAPRYHAHDQAVDQLVALQELVENRLEGQHGLP